MSEAEAQELLAENMRNVEVVKPYLNGQDLNDHPDQEASRWVIDFADWPFERASQYLSPFALVENRVKAEVVAKKGYPGWASRWWQFWNVRPGLRAAVANLDRAIVLTRHSKSVTPAFVSGPAVKSDATVVFAYDGDGHFGLLTSSFHRTWALSYASTIRTDLRYTPSDVFETYPQPSPQSGLAWVEVDTAGRRLNVLRVDLMVHTNLGLTKTYNRVHNPDEHDPDIVRLRELHVELDHAVRDAYGWTDLELNHHHWTTPQGMRFTVSPEAKDELLDRLLELNHERYAAEVAAGLHEKKAKKAPAKRSSKSAANHDSLL